MRFEYCKGNKQYKSACIMIRPQDLPQAENIVKGKFTFKCDEDPANTYS